MNFIRSQALAEGLPADCLPLSLVSSLQVGSCCRKDQEQIGLQLLV